MKTQFRSETAVSQYRTPPVFSFGSTRKTKSRVPISSEIPGPGTYFNGPPPTQKRGGLSFSRTSRDLNFGRPQCGAPVGSYTIPSSFGPVPSLTERRGAGARASTMPSAVFQLPKHKKREAFCTPGPGAYDPRLSGSRRALPKNTSGLRADRTTRGTYLDDVLKKEENKPPVGAYNAAVPSHAPSAAYVFALPQGKRRVPAGPAGPEPASYDPVLPRKEANPAYSFQGHKVPKTRRNDAPSPGTYDPKPVVPRVVGGHFTERRLPVVKSEGPDPGSYDPQHAFPSSPSFSFRGRGEDFIDKSLKHQGPEPATYRPRDPAAPHVSTMKFTERRIPEVKSSAPPPGSYDPKIVTKRPVTYTFGERRPSKVANDTPGPGAYNAGSFVYERPSR